jgi:hypothetical protein
MGLSYPLPEGGIGALKVQQRTALMNGRGDGLAHQHAMIAGVESLHRAALDGSQCVVEQRRSGDARPPGNAVEAALAAPGEVNGEVLLLFRQNVQREKIGLLKSRELKAVESDRRHHKRRVERERIERVDRQAVRRAVMGSGGQHANARGKSRTRAAEFVAGEMVAGMTCVGQLSSLSRSPWWSGSNPTFQADACET